MSKQVIISSSPTIFLKGLNPVTICSGYESGFFKSFNVEYFKNFNIKLLGNLSSVSNFGTDSNSNIFTKKSSTNEPKVFCTDNCSFFNSFNQGINENMKCYHCRRKITGLLFGAPVKYEMLIGKDNEEILVLHCITCDCCFECANASIDQYVPEDQQGFSRTILSFAFEKICPGKILKKSPDWKLLKENGGCLSETEFFQNTHKFNKISNIVFSASKNIYEKLKD